jgi:hypothetical protein
MAPEESCSVCGKSGVMAIDPGASQALAAASGVPIRLFSS